MSSDNAEKVTYNNIKFTKTNNGWMNYLGDREIVLINNPKEIGNYSSGINLNELNSAQKIYLSINPKDNLVLFGLQNNIIPFLTPKISTACYEDNDACANIPIKTCKDASKDIKIILIKKSENNNLYYKENCLVIEGSKEEITKMIDKLTLELLYEY